MTFLTRKKCTYRTLAAVIGSMALTSAVQATVLNVPGTYATIQAAVNAAAASGDTIVVAAGSYSENVTISAKVITLRGAQFGVDARGRVASETIVSPAVAGTNTINLAGSTGATVIDGFTFTGGTSLGVIFTSGNGNDGLQIINNRFSGYSQAAVWFNRGGANITLDKNVMDGSSISGSGQAIFGNGPQSFAGLFITNNWVINNTGRYGVFIDGNHNVGESATRAPLISGNLFDNNLQGMNLGSRSFGTLGAPVLGAYGGTISNNTFSNHPFDGVQGGLQHCLITGNTFQNNGRNGLGLTALLGSAPPTDVDGKGARNCTVTLNTFQGNGFVNTGFGVSCSATQFAGTISTNHINNNTISGNRVGAGYLGNEIIDMENNFWGNNTGPTDPTGANSTSGCTSGSPFVADLINPGGTGDSINEVATGTGKGIDYCPFTVLPSLSINPISACYTGTQVVVKIRMTNQNNLVVGGQFFLSYDNTRLSFVSADPGSPPFTEEVYESVNTGAGTIDYAVGVLAPNPGTMADTDMVVLTFNKIGNTCATANLVSFRSHTPPTRLTNMFGDPLTQLLNNLPSITIDSMPPTFTAGCPLTAINVNSDAGYCTANVTVPTPAVTDNCTASPGVVGVRSDAQALNAPYPAGTTTITWTATDGCGNQSQCLQNVIVSGLNAITTTVELQGVWNVPSGSLSISRCIRFEVYKCGNAPVVIDQVVNFFSPSPGVPASGSTTLLVPCTGGTYTCITARDRLHTLRRTDGEFTISGTQYVADFTSAGTDDSLIGGNLNDDDFIDILDFGVFVGQYSTNYGSGNTTCSTAYPHADISGNGSVFADDYTFIQINFLKAREANCCGLPTVSAPGGGPGNGRDGGPVTRISVRELINRGMQDLVVADLNHDGWLDDKDIAVFLNGGH